MANTFRNFSAKNIATSNTVIYKADVSSHTATIVLGLTLANKSSNSVKATAYLTSNTVLDLLITQLEQVHQQTHKHLQY